MTTLKHGEQVAVVTRIRPGSVLAGTVMQDHPEANAVTVKVSGDDWIFTRGEVWPPVPKPEVWPEWFVKFVDHARNQPDEVRKKGRFGLNKAALSRTANVSKEKVDHLIGQCQKLGISIAPQAP